MTESGEGAVADGPLAGLRVAVTRSVDRAGGLLAALEAAGAEPVLVPLIDFEMSDNALLGAGLRRLAAGEYSWLVVSSITTVRALKQWCEGAGTSLTDIIPSSTSAATIGPTSVAVLAAEGVQASLAPVDVQSAAGLVALWPEFDPAAGNTSNKVLLPQSNIAEPTLVNGLRAKGWDPEIVTAYRTVDYPARPEVRLTATLAAREASRETQAAHKVQQQDSVVDARSSERGWRDFLPSPRKLGGEPSKIPYEVAQRPQKSYCPREDLAASDHTLLTPAEAAGEMQSGAIHAVVLASGSAARRTAATMAPLPEGCMVIAIGEPTRKEAERLGMRVAATAEHPTPDGIVAALAAAHTHFHNQDSQEPS